ncbi:MAG: phytanoyl-CoA dioxygenase family protein [Pseudomonadota bacterium]
MKDAETRAPGYYTLEECDLSDFIALVDSRTRPEDVPHASAVQHQIPVYKIADLQGVLADPGARRDLMAEWARLLLSGAGVLALRGAYADTAVIDEATEVYNDIIREERQGAGGGGDHFAASGANDRVWNALQKLCDRAPEVFLRYFANTAIAAVCEAWLGPNAQMTAQINLVHPGGTAQQAHRDYHLGFQTAEQSALYPAHVHDLSPLLTLQGAIAHCDMPVESGPTKLLPFSQAYRPGYAAWRREDFRAVFEERCVQLPLAKGDALFFNPALFHAAGSNTSTDIHRMANLLQVSSAFGRAMESVDRMAMCKKVYPQAVAALENGTLTRGQIVAAISATAEGYPFPTSLDRDPPKGGLAPESQRAYMLRAIHERASPDAVAVHLDAMARARQA